MILKLDDEEKKLKQKERRKMTQKRWIEKDPEKAREIYRKNQYKYYLLHREKVNETAKLCGRKYYQENKEEIKRKRRERYRRDKEKRLAMNNEDNNNN